MPRCFVIQRFDKGAYDKRYRDVLVPAIELAGLEAYRVDEDPGSTVVIEDIEKGIRESAICLADITPDNPNVWYEVGFALANGKPVVLICAKKRPTRFPFDVHHRQVIQYSLDSPRDFEELKGQIASRLKAQAGNTHPLPDSNYIKTLSKETTTPAASPRIYSGVREIYGPLTTILREANHENLTLDVLGLTLFSAWPMFLDPAIRDGLLRAWRLNIYVLSPDFIRNSPFFPDGWVHESEAKLKLIEKFAAAHSNPVDGPRITVVKYSRFPAIHGFRTQSGHLFISYIHWNSAENLLDDPHHFYEEFSPEDKSDRASQYRSLFQNWIEHAESSGDKKVF